MATTEGWHPCRSGLLHRGPSPRDPATRGDQPRALSTCVRTSGFPSLLTTHKDLRRRRCRKAGAYPIRGEKLLILRKSSGCCHVPCANSEHDFTKLFAASQLIKSRRDM